MLELKAAPSPNPVLPAANAAPAAHANAAEGASADAAHSQGAPFAAVLKEHLAQAADKKAAAKAVDALLAVQSAAAPVVAAETPSDPISLLAPMLSGIALPPPAPETGEVAATPGEEQEDAGGAAILIAAPAAPAAPAVAAVTSVPAAAGQTDATVDNLPQEAPKPLPASANIAATTATVGEGPNDKAADTAPVDFESALTTAREAQVVANPHMAVRAPQAATPAPASAVVATPVGAAGWDREVGDKITWMVGRNETRAELVLNPPQLGRVEVSLSMNGDQATATFTSANATVREALENAMPRLREILQGSGISLGQTQVGAESFQQSAARQENGDNPARGQGRDAEATAPRGGALGESAPAHWLRRGDGLVDTFA